MLSVICFDVCRVVSDFKLSIDQSLYLMITLVLSAGADLSRIFENFISLSSAWSRCRSALSVTKTKIRNRLSSGRYTACINMYSSCDSCPLLWSFSILATTECNVARQSSLRRMGGQCCNAYSLHSMIRFLHVP